MTQNNNLSVLPWYTSISEQNHRKSYAYGQIYPLYTKKSYLLPFQIIRKSLGSSAPITSCKLYDKSGTFIEDMTAKITSGGLSIVQFSTFGYDVIVFPGTTAVSTQMKEGQYYAVLSDGTNTWYSDIFTSVSDVSGYLKIEWFDDENVVFDGGQIVYQSPAFRNVLYLCTELGKPDYEFDEEGETRDGYFFPEKQLSTKKYKCTILAPEYLCDVMRLIRMADHVIVTDKYGRQYDCDTFLITPEWQAQGDLASVDIEFQTDTVVKKIGRGISLNGTGDFNSDFNNDYDI